MNQGVQVVLHLGDTCATILHILDQIYHTLLQGVPYTTPRAHHTHSLCLHHHPLNMLRPNCSVEMPNLLNWSAESAEMPNLLNYSAEMKNCSLSVVSISG